MTAKAGKYSLDPKHTFRFYNQDGTVYWESPLYRAKCNGKLDDGTICGKYTSRIHPYCHGCTIRHFRVAVSPSLQGPGAGLGLFADDASKHEGDVVFQAGVFIAPYMGEIVSEEVLEERYTGVNGESEDEVCCPYAIETSEGETVDATLLRGPAAFCNDSKLKKYNAVLSEVPILGIVATKPIHQGEEILVSYGKQYWKSKHFKFDITVDKPLPNDDRQIKKRKLEE